MQATVSKLTGTKRKSREDGFGRSTRFYETPDGNTYPSVTSIISCIAKPALVNWAARTEREMVSLAAASLYEDAPAVKMSRPAFLASLSERLGKQKAWQKELAKAADIGSQAHALIEWNMRLELGQAPGASPEVGPKSAHAFSIYEAWRATCRLEPKLIEQTVYSTKHGYAGTLDFYGFLDHPDKPGERIAVVGDWKTGKAIYGEAGLQAAAYATALHEMGHGAAETWGCIVRLPKVETDPEFEVKLISPAELAQLFTVFLSAFDLWKWQEASR